MFPPQALAELQQPAQQTPRKSRGMLYAIAGVVVVGAVVAIAVVASGGKKKPDPHRMWLETLESTRDAICACKAKDDACVRVAMDNLGTMESALGSDAKREQDDEEVHERIEQIKKCIDKELRGDKAPKAPAGPDAFKEVMQDLSEMRDKMCKCPGSGDPYCAAQVNADFASTISTSKELLSDKTLSEDDQKTLQAGIVRVLACEESAKKGTK